MYICLSVKLTSTSPQPSASSTSCTFNGQNSNSSQRIPFCDTLYITLILSLVSDWREHCILYSHFTVFVLPRLCYCECWCQCHLSLAGYRSVTLFISLDSILQRGCISIEKLQFNCSRVFCDEIDDFYP